MNKETIAERRIVVLDGYTPNPGDLSWDALEALGPCEIHDRTLKDQVVARAKDAEIVLTNKTVLDRRVLGELPKLQYVSVLATGYNVVDVAAARQRGIPVSNVPIYGTSSVAQMVFAHILNLTQHAAHHADTVQQGRWAESPDFCYWDFPLVELDGLTLGVVGFGRIGQATARIARAFNMKLLAYDPNQNPNDHPDVSFVGLDELFSKSDVVTLHCVLNEETKGLVNPRRLALMKPTAFLVNTSRGPLIDEPALATALNGGRLAGAGLDVLSVEPPPVDHVLYKAKNCYITPHIAWATRAARARLMETTIGNVRAFLAGKPQNVVN